MITEFDLLNLLKEIADRSLSDALPAIMKFFLDNNFDKTLQLDFIQFVQDKKLIKSTKMKEVRKARETKKAAKKKNGQDCDTCRHFIYMYAKKASVCTGCDNLLTKQDRIWFDAKNKIAYCISCVPDKEHLENHHTYYQIAKKQLQAKIDAAITEAAERE